MEIKRVFGGSEKDILDKKFNIFIGISLGNKWFCEENLRGYLRWALDNTRERVLVLIADEIHAINCGVRDRRNKKVCLEKALRVGDKMRGLVENLIGELPEEERKKVSVLGWKDYRERDLFCERYTPLVYEKFESNIDFRNSILDIIREAMTDRDFSEEDYLKFAKYVLEEFICISSGANIDSVYYGVLPYPFEGKLDYFINDLQGGKIFCELNRRLPEQKVVRVVLS